MKITRRFFFSILICLLCVLPAFPQITTPQKYLALVGTYTTKTESKGVYALDFDSRTGKLSLVGLAAESPDPSWVVIHPSGKYAYAANEAGKQSAISAFSIDSSSGKLTLLNKLPAQGEDPCHLSFDESGKFLFVANYTSGNVVVFPFLPDGRLGEHTSAVNNTGTLGPNKERQEAPHAHWIASPWHDQNFLVADLGLDRVLFYDFSPSNGKLKPHAPSAGPKGPFAQNSLELKPGAGPRHVASGKFPVHRHFVYVLGEIDSTVSVFAESKEGIYSLVQNVSTLPSGFSGRNEPAEITIHPTGKWLFTSNRGHDSIAVFKVDTSSGMLSPAGIFPTGGKEPRHFALDPTGQFLLAENENSNNIVVFRIDQTTGALSEVSRLEGIPSPVCLTFLPAP